MTSGTCGGTCPSNDVHPHAQLAAEAAEVAADQGTFWDMHDLLLRHQEVSGSATWTNTPPTSGSTSPGSAAISASAPAARIAEEVDSADLSGVSRTPTFFINGRRHYGSYDITALTAAVLTAKAASVPAAASGRHGDTTGDPGR